MSRGTWISFPVVYQTYCAAEMIASLAPGIPPQPLFILAQESSTRGESLRAPEQVAKRGAVPI